MTIRDFINAYIGPFEQIKVMEYTGDFSAIGADPEEDYSEVGTYRALGYIGDYIPHNVINRKVEFFSIEGGIITIWMEN